MSKPLRIQGEDNASLIHQKTLKALLSLQQKMVNGGWGRKEWPRYVDNLGKCSVKMLEYTTKEPAEKNKSKRERCINLNMTYLSVAFGN